VSLNSSIHEDNKDITESSPKSLSLSPDDQKRL